MSAFQYLVSCIGSQDGCVLHVQSARTRTPSFSGILAHHTHLAMTHICRTFLQVPFLNLLAAVADRAGSVRVRVGGNTQEYATLVASLPNYEIIAKDKSTSTNPVSYLLYAVSLRRPFCPSVLLARLGSPTVWVESACTVVMW